MALALEASVDSLPASDRQALSAAYGSLCSVPDELPPVLLGELGVVEELGGVYDELLVSPVLLEAALLGELCAA